MIDVEKLIKQNSELMALLKIIHSFQLNDCWLCAGTLRNYIWDYLSTGSTSSNINFSDIDVIFFDQSFKVFFHLFPPILLFLDYIIVLLLELEVRFWDQ